MSALLNGASSFTVNKNANQLGSDFSVATGMWKYSEYGFKVVSINTDNSRGFKSVKPFVRSKKYTFDVLSDPRSKYFKKLAGNICPYTVIVDKDSTIISKHVGFSPGDEIELEKKIVSLLDIKPAKSDSTDNEN